MQCACIMSSVACPVLQDFSTLSHKWHNFQEKEKLLNIKYVFCFSVQLLFETVLILRRFLQDITINVHRFSFEVPVCLVRF
jgi:hypothetical protein